MPYEITSLETERCVSVTHIGETSIKDFQTARNEAAERLKTKGWHKIIFDSRENEHPPTLIEAYGLTASLSCVFLPEIKIAVLISRDLELDIKFLEDSAQNAYSLSFKVFYDY